jgi:two-component system OmpR family sensor kinase
MRGHRRHHRGRWPWHREHWHDHDHRHDYDHDHDHDRRHDGRPDHDHDDPRAGLHRHPFFWGPHPWWRQHPLWRHHPLQRYYRAQLHRRIFWWFGASIFFTIFLVGVVTRLTRWHFADSPPRGLLYIGLPALALWIFSGKIARRIARPLAELVHVSTEIGNGNLDARAVDAVRGIDEVARLARAVNDMAERIKRQLAGQRELLAGVSHELRTPLARLRVLLDIARDRGVSESVFADWERELLEMDQLVGELLASARLDFQSVDHSLLDAVDVATRALARAGEPSERLSVAARSIPLQADPTLLARALANLLENARKHGRGLTRLEVAVQGPAVVFAVEDRGPGIPPEIAERIFEPFVRGPDGRGPSFSGSGAPTATATPSLHASETSLGLGLALVARIARAHGGRVFALPLTPVGTRFVFEIPAVAPPTPPK